MERDPNDRFGGTGPRTPQSAEPGGRETQSASRQMSGTMTGREEGATEQGIDTAKQKANQAADQTRTKVNQLADTTKQKVNQAADKAKETANQVADQAKQTVGQAKEKATQLKATLADKLDQGADKLRQKTASTTSEMQPSGAGDGATAEASQTMNRVGGAVAGGMEKTADWLRTADFESVKTDLEHQVRSHPGRSLVVALGLGYVLGRLFSSSSEG